MNINNLKKLIGQIERLPENKFTMGHYVNHGDCGTTACIAGWCFLLNSGKTEHYGAMAHNFSVDFLEIEEDTADKLFTNVGRGRERFWPDTKHNQLNMTKAQALIALNTLLSHAQS